jgi:hypothetical protein
MAAMLQHHATLAALCATVLAAVEPAAPASGWSVDFGGWIGSGATDWSTSVSYLADPLSKLEYDYVAAGPQVAARYAPGQNWELRLDARLGQVLEGTLRDRDWTHGQTLFSDTESDLRTDPALVHAQAQCDWTLMRNDRGRIGLWAGLRFEHERLVAEGLRWNTPVSWGIDGGTGFIDSLYLNPPGTWYVDEDVITNRVTRVAPGIGIHARQRLGENWLLEASFGLEPATYVRMTDTHHLRWDYLGSRDLVLEGFAFGSQGSLALRRHFGPQWSAYLGLISESTVSTDTLDVVESPFSWVGYLDYLRSSRDPGILIYNSLTQQTYGPVAQSLLLLHIGAERRF